VSKPARTRGSGTIRASVYWFFRCLLAYVRETQARRDQTLLPNTTDDLDYSDEPTQSLRPVVLTLRLRPLADIMRDAEGGAEPIGTLVSFPRETVALAPLSIGAETLGRITIRENEQHVSWRQTSYQSLPTTAYVIANALVHGSAGLIGIGDQMVIETTWHTEPSRHRYRREDGAIHIEADRLPFLSGTHLNLLTPGGGNYWHALIDGVAKLSIIPEALMENVQTILFSSDAIGQEDFLGLSGLPRSVALRPVHPWETFRVQTLVLPWDLHGVFDYHPVINRFFDVVLTHHTVTGHHRVERLYIDRRGSAQRRLSNEDEVVTALEAIGFVAIRLEDLSIDRQVALFRQAAVIVSPHGAGLTNIGFASPGCIVIELMMDAYLNWCFRRIAALRTLNYDCAIGTAHRPWKDLDPEFHDQVWEIRVEDVVNTVSRAIALHSLKS
jgi:capsular polysaccharide biosynthesis protein